MSTVQLQQAMFAFKAAISGLEAFLVGTRDLPDVERAAGYRLILGINKWVTDRYFLGADTARPRFIKFMDEFSQWGLGNPDNLYFSAQVDGTRPYVIRGERGTTVDICVELRTGIGRNQNGQHSRTLGALDAGTLVVDPDGTFTVHIGGPDNVANYIPQHPEADLVFVRRTFGDWDAEHGGELWIEAAGEALDPAPPPSSADIARSIEALAQRLTFVTTINDEQVSEFRSNAPINAFPPAPQEGPSIKTKSGGGAFPGQRNSIGWWHLPDDQALVISITPPRCRYLGFMIGHPLWFAALDFENRQNSLNLMQAHHSEDGQVHLVLSATDPGFANWIDPGHLREGFMFVRCQGVEGTYVEPSVRVVPFSELASVLPLETPTVGFEERRTMLQQRRIAVQRRSL
ncbi:hypothetical protein [Novosphingobium sp. 9U]|uniref:hypothetical protein n=1 Tax=Novosphingobium sp. 9U TaxID=2653158 RepID=UPI0012F2B913|nr:hypothetical protein [Novosphingobium sp. 9U]VWX50595.1 conserved hypothetical protein [Novosphingobium sp. 9U]